MEFPNVRGTSGPREVISWFLIMASHSLLGVRLRRNLWLLALNTPPRQHQSLLLMNIGPRSLNLELESPNTVLIELVLG